VAVRDNPALDDETTALEPVGVTAVIWNYAGCLVCLKEIADLPALLFYKRNGSCLPAMTGRVS